MQYCETVNRKAVCQVRPKRPLPGRLLERPFQRRCGCCGCRWYTLSATLSPPLCTREASLEGCSGLSRGYPSLGFPGGSAVKNPFADTRAAGDAGLITGSGRSPGGGNGNLPANPMDRGARWASVHGVTKSRTRPNE